MVMELQDKPGAGSNGKSLCRWASTIAAYGDHHSLVTTRLCSRTADHLYAVVAACVVIVDVIAVA